MFNIRLAFLSFKVAWISPFRLRRTTVFWDFNRTLRLPSRGSTAISLKLQSSCWAEIRQVTFGRFYKRRIEKRAVTKAHSFQLHLTNRLVQSMVGSTKHDKPNRCRKPVQTFQSLEHWVNPPFGRHFEIADLRSPESACAVVCAVPPKHFAEISHSPQIVSIMNRM